MASGSAQGNGKQAGHRLPLAFDDRTRAAQVLAALVSPVVLGLVAGLTLGWSALAYWIVQVVATIGGVLAGTGDREVATGRPGGDQQHDVC